MKKWLMSALAALCLALNVGVAWGIDYTTLYVWSETDKAWRAWINANFAAISSALQAVTSTMISNGTILNVDINASAAIDITKLSESIIQADGGQAFTANQSHGDFSITNVNSIYLDNIYPDGSTYGITVEMSDNKSIAFQFKEAANEYIKIVTTDAGEYVQVSKAFKVDGGAFYFNPTGAALDFNFAGDNQASLLHSDGTNDRIGIGSASPAYLLDVAGDTYIQGALYAGTTSTYFDTSGNLFFPHSVKIQLDTAATYIQADASSPENLYLYAADSIYLKPAGTTPVVTINVNKTSTTPLFVIDQDNASGDSSIKFIQNTDVFTLGIDATDKAFKVSDGVVLGTNDRFSISAAGDTTVGQDLTVGDYLATKSLAVYSSSLPADPGDGNMSVSGTASFVSIAGDFGILGARNTATYTMNAGTGACTGGPMTQDGLLSVWVDSSEGNAVYYTLSIGGVESGFAMYNPTSAGTGEVTRLIKKGESFAIARTYGSGTYHVIWQPYGSDN